MLSTTEKWPTGTANGIWIWLFGKHLPSQNLEPKVCIGTGKRETAQAHGHYFIPALSTASQLCCSGIACEQFPRTSSLL